jgi:modified peptide precursor CbpA
MKRKTKKGQAIIARRKACKATGTGLSHYILMDREAK